MSASPIDLHWVQQPGTRMGAMHRPTTLEGALRLLAADTSVRPVAGGTDLVLELARSGGGGQVDLLDLTRIAGFSSLDFDDADEIVFGAGVRHVDVLASEHAIAHLLPLAQACLEIGSPQLRNRATIVGNLVTASPANDTISALLALDATVVIARLEEGAIAQRSVKVADFYTGFRATVLQPGELISEVRIPKPTPTQRGIWVKVGLRKAQAISVVHAGFNLDLAADGTVTMARIALGSVGPTVALSLPAAQALIGSELTSATIDQAAAAAADSVVPIADGRATAEYRGHSVFTVVRRALVALAAGTERDRWPERVPLLSVSPDTPPPAPAPMITEVSVTVNGASHSHPAVGTGTLLDWLRETASVGTKEGCAEGECGACTVHLDGAAVMSCLVPAAQADGSDVRTIEGLESGGNLRPMQHAFVDKFAVQCGYCIPGFIMAAEQLAAEFDSVPTRDEVELALSGNLCRCTGYYSIIDAVTSAIQAELV